MASPPSDVRSSAGPETPPSTSQSTGSSLQPPLPVYGHHSMQPSDGLSAASGSPRWLSGDPRASSTQSLVPSVLDLDSDQRRRLLVVYIHGFYGNDQSFHSFPAHVHSYLKITLAESHVVHSKIYPRYKTYKAIEVARDNFSNWLEPHENDETDVILVGHSMGGLLAAEIVLMPNPIPYGTYPYKHRILGTISMDSPFLGLHPGVVASGLKSIFQPASPETAPQQSPPPIPQSESTHSISSPEPSLHPSQSGSELTPMTSISATSLSPPAAEDPTFNQPFFNDLPFKERPWMKRIVHFAIKHKAEGIFEASRQHILSHLEFGGVMTDYPGLHSRYNRLRALEDVDDITEISSPPSGSGSRQPKPARVRFVNYYTASTGRSKPPLKPASPHLKPPGQSQPQSQASSGSSTPRISIEDHSDTDRPELVELIAAQPDPDGATSPKEDGGVDSVQHPETPSEPIEEDEPDLPPIPNLPPKPESPDLTKCTDKNLRHQAEKEAKRAQKAYDQAVKDRDRAIKERQKLVQKRNKKAEQEAARLERHEQNRRLRGEWAQQQQRDAAATKKDGAADTAAAPKKDRKFCTLPKKVNGIRDPTWARVFMGGFDEVGAHCGLFLSGDHYERLVGDVGERIVGWVHEDLTRRAILGIS